MELPPVVGRLVGDSSHFDRTMRSAGDSTGVLSKGLGGVKGAIAAVGGAFAAVKVGGFFKDAIMGASDMEETLSKVGVVFGDMADQVKADAKFMADSFGIPKQQFLDASASIGLIGKASGIAEGELGQFSTNMARLATDASSFYNVPLEEALAAIQSGLVGEAEPMRRFGVLLSAQAVDAEAARLGLEKVNGAYTEGAKAQARASLIMSGMTDASGDLERTQGSLSNRLRELKGRFQNFTAELGSKAIPFVLKLLDSFESLGSKVGPIFGHIRGAWDAVMGGFQNADAAIGPSVGGFEAAMLRIGAAVRNAVDWVRDNWPKIREIIGSVLERAKEIVSSAIDIIQTAWRNFGTEIETVARTGFQAARLIIEGALKAIEVAVPPVREAIKTLIEILGNPVFQTAALIISTVLIPAIIAWGVQSTIAAGKVVAAWVVTNASAIAAGATQGLVFLLLSAQWVKMALAALASAAQVAAAWLIAIGPIALVIAAIAGLVALVIIHFDTIKSVIAGAWNWVKDHISTVMRVIVGVMTGGMSELVLLVIRHWSQIRSAVSEAIGDVVSLVASLPGRAIGALGDLGGLLFNAGRRLIGGFVDGIKSMIGAVADTLGGITSKLTSWKGPPARDAKLLFGTGQLVMSGFIGGLESRYGDVRSSLAGVTKSLGVTPGLSVSGGQAAAAATHASGGLGGTQVIQLVVDGKVLAQVVREEMQHRGSQVGEGNLFRNFGSAA